MLAVGCSPTDGSRVDPGEDSDLLDDVVVVADDGLELVGTLRRPDGAAPHPAILIIHGSGPLSRDGEVAGQLGLTLPRSVAVYRQLAEGLQSRGYAVLTWDKRSCGAFNGCSDNEYPVPDDDVTVDTFRDDASAVLDQLASREDVGDIVVLGHSQGGTIAAGLLAQPPEIDATVLLATPAIPIDAVLAAQAVRLEELVVAAGQAGTAPTDQAIASLQALADDVAAIGDDTFVGTEVGGASRAFWASWIDASLAAPSRVAASGTPVLALGGGQDFNVPPEQVLAWEPFLPAGGDSRILPGITHALTTLRNDDPATIGPADLGTEVDGAVIEAIADWLDDTLERDDG